MCSVQLIRPAPRSPDARAQWERDLTLPLEARKQFASFCNKGQRLLSSKPCLYHLMTACASSGPFLSRYSAAPSTVPQRTIPAVTGGCALLLMSSQHCLISMSSSIISRTRSGTERKTLPFSLISLSLAETSRKFIAEMIPGQRCSLPKYAAALTHCSRKSLFKRQTKSSVRLCILCMPHRAIRRRAYTSRGESRMDYAPCSQAVLCLTGLACALQAGGFFPRKGGEPSCVLAPFVALIVPSI